MDRVGLGNNTLIEVYGYIPPNLMCVSIMERKGFGKIINVEWRSYDEREIKAYDATKIKRSITWWLNGHRGDGISYVSPSADFSEI